MYLSTILFILFLCIVSRLMWEAYKYNRNLEALKKTAKKN